MKQEGRIQRESLGSEGYLFKMARESLSEEVTVKLRWGKNIIERGTDKCTLRPQGRGELGNQRSRAKASVVRCPDRGEARQNAVREVGVGAHLIIPSGFFPTTHPPQIIFFKSAKEDKNFFLCIWRWVLLSSLDWWACGLHHFPLHPQALVILSVLGPGGYGGDGGQSRLTQISLKWIALRQPSILGERWPPPQLAFQSHAKAPRLFQLPIRSVSFYGWVLSHCVNITQP